MKPNSLLACASHLVWCLAHVPKSPERQLFGSSTLEYQEYPYAIAINYTIATSTVAIANDIANAFVAIANVINNVDSCVAIVIASVAVLLLGRSAQVPK